MQLLASIGLLAGQGAHAQPAEPSDARAALRAGELDRALSLAQAAASAQPGDADALTVLGLVEAKQGDCNAALAHFDLAIAAAGPHATAALLWNRGACLSALGQDVDAERAFLAAAERAASPLDALSWLNAGFAALDAGSTRRARAHLARARALDRDENLAPELADLAGEIAQRSALEHERVAAQLERGELEQARLAAAGALGEQPDDAVLWYLSGLIAYRQGRDGAAEAQLNQARELGLDGARDALAADYLDLIAGGLWLAGRGLHVDLELAGGYDSNAVQAGIGDSTLLPASAQSADSPFARARVELSYGLAPRASSFVLARYSLEQLAYSASALDLLNAQVHELALEAEQRLGTGWRFSALGRGAFEAAGLADLRAFSLAGGGELAVAYERPYGLRTRLTAGLSYTHVLDDAFAFSSGTRLELGLDSRYARGRLHAGAGLGYRAELLGTQRIAASYPPELCTDCSAGEYVIPLAYQGPRAALWFAYRLLDMLQVSARIAGELRSHRHASYLAASLPDGAVARVSERRERDSRLNLGGGLTLELPEPFELDLDYELTLARSNIDNTLGGEHALDYANLNFVRHVISLGVAARF